MKLYSFSSSSNRVKYSYCTVIAYRAVTSRCLPPLFEHVLLVLLTTNIMTKSFKFVTNDL